MTCFVSVWDVTLKSINQLVPYGRGVDARCRGLVYTVVQELRHFYYHSVRIMDGMLSLAYCVCFCSVTVFSAETLPIDVKFGVRRRQYSRQVL